MTDASLPIRHTTIVSKRFIGEKGMRVTIVDCARCGETHYDLEFTRFTRPIELEKTYTYWTVCPETDKPILMRIIEESAVDPNAI